MTRRPRWSPRLMPEVRRDLRQWATGWADWHGNVLAAAEQRGLPDDPQFRRFLTNAPTAQAGYERLAAGLSSGGCFWVSEPMAQMALDASQDVPVLSWQDRPDLHGILGVAGGLPPLDGYSVDGVAWATGQDGDLLITPCTLSPVPAARGHVSTPTARYLTPTGLLTVRLPLALDGAPPGLEPPQYALVSWLAAVWTMMMTPTVAERRSLDARTGRESTPQTPPSAGVTLIDLRPLRYVHAERDEATGRRLTVRHLVRGHWTHQPHGPGRSQRRLQWIAPYIKGPSGAPLKSSEDRVMVWRRA